MPGRVLVIAGSDSGGGAGIQADLKSVMALGGYATTAITAITAQNTIGVQAIQLLPAEIVEAQIDSVLTDIGADAVKTGMIGAADTVRRVAARLEAVGVPIVVDPVMIAKGGQRLLSDDALHAMQTHLLPLATIITPNIPEAEALLGRPVLDPVEAALDLRARFSGAVLLKGGHAPGEELVDTLADETGIHQFRARRIDTRHTHGTGCTLASAISVGVAHGMPLRSAVQQAHSYVLAAIAAAPGYGAGHGPLGHLTHG